MNLKLFFTFNFCKYPCHEITTKRYCLLFLLLFFAARGASAQNLVPNPSFEDTVNCPTSSGQVWRAQGWYIVENSPDYFNACCTSSMQLVGVPYNFFGFRNAATGGAYCGFVPYLDYFPTNEKIGIRLNTVLNIGTRYYVSFRLSSVNSHTTTANGACNKIGMLFSTIKYDLNNLPPTNNYSQFYTDSIITDTTNWSLVKGNFIADSSYEYLTIGNFFDRFHTDTLRYWFVNGNNSLRVYYFIDDVCVTTNSAGCTFDGAVSTPTISPPFAVYPNPANDLITVKLNSVNANSISLINLLGQIIYENKALKNNSVDEIDVSRYRCGVYLLQINTKEKIITQKISIIH